MAWQQPSPRIRELIREGARIALNPSPEWIEELDRATIAANPAIANDPVLAKVVQTANRANLVYWAAANLRDPGARVPANLGTEPLRMARDLVRRGLDTVAFNIYRTGEHIGWRFWMGIAFELTSDPQELRELLDVSARSVNDFIEATLTGIAAQVQSEHDELTRSTHAERLEVVGLILDGAPALDLYGLLSPRADRHLLARPEFKAMFLDDLLNGSRKQLAAPFADVIAFARDWGFRLDEVKVPVRWWHGDHDHIVPFSHGEHVVSRLPDAKLLHLPGESHLAGLGRGEEILSTLMQIWDRDLRK